MDNLKTIYCPECGAVAQEVIHAALEVRVGWYCAACGHFETTIGRERLVESE